jgi:acyl dehydratase
MNKLDRRTFLKLMGQGAAVLGIGLSGRAWAQSGEAPAKKASYDYWDDWEFYYPGKYNTEDARVLKKFQAELALVNRRNVDIDDLISGKIDPRDVGGFMGAREITLEEMMTLANSYVGNNPFFTDRNYARRTKYGDLITFPLVSSLEVMPAMPKAEGIGDYMVVSAHNDTNSYYKPIYEGDTLYTVIDKQYCQDITPAEGSFYRTFAMSGRARVFNQKGELVAEGANILKESFRRHKNPAKRHADKAHAWESPDWWSRKAHQYTDKDWDKIISIWKNEKIRGAEVLYWDDVNIGDEPTPTAVGPVLTETETDMLGYIPQWSADIKKNVLDPKTFPKMVKNKQGIYVLPEYLEKKPRTSAFLGGGGSTHPELSNRDGRAVLQNSVSAKFAAGMICNWMGDEGWLQRIGWDIMELPPGYIDSVSYDEYPTVIPPIPIEIRPALFDKYPYLEKVPYMRGKRAAGHPMEGDLIISRAYVTNKYRNGDECFVDLTWWCETLDNYLVEEGFATVKLPKR